MDPPSPPAQLSPPSSQAAPTGHQAQHRGGVGRMGLREGHLWGPQLSLLPGDTRCQGGHNIGDTASAGPGDSPPPSGCLQGLV